jgi:hypothetical protein
MMVPNGGIPDEQIAYIRQLEETVAKQNAMISHLEDLIHKSAKIVNHLPYLCASIEGAEPIEIAVGQLQTFLVLRQL